LLSLSKEERKISDRGGETWFGVSVTMEMFWERGEGISRKKDLKIFYKLFKGKEEV